MAPSRSKSTPGSPEPAATLAVVWVSDETRVLAEGAIEASPGDELLLPADVARSLIDQGYCALTATDPTEV